MLSCQERGLAKRQDSVIYLSVVSLELTVYAIPAVGCSVRFFPTLGRLINVGMPMSERVARSPMPEFIRIWGVLIAPADKITSFVAVKRCLDTGKQVGQLFRITR